MAGRFGWQVRVVGAHNDIGELDPRPGNASQVSAAVVIPVYNRIDLLRRTLLGLVASTLPCPVVVADDGSDDDVGEMATGFADRLDVRVVSQDHRGYGAGRARNLGAAVAEASVLIFIDADCIPHPDLVRRHLEWHAAAENLVTVGERRHVRATSVDPEELASGTADLAADEVTGFTGKADFRELLRRRTAGLSATDEAFRTFVSSNVAVPRHLFEAVGGFDESFTRWGGEDTELGWRLWQAGAFFVIADKAVVYHQLDEDHSGGAEGRTRSRVLNDGVIAHKVPHRFYRTPRNDLIYEVPKISVVVHSLPSNLDDVWFDLRRQSAPDLELILAGVNDSHEPAASLMAGDPRIGAAADLDQALEMARGELVMVVHGALALDHRLVGRVVKRFADSPSVSSLTVGYTLPSDPPAVYRMTEDADRIDRAWGAGIPLIAVSRRREWSKMTEGTVTERWTRIRSLERAEHLDQGLGWIPSLEPGPRPLDFVANRPLRTQVRADVRARPRRALKTLLLSSRARRHGIPYQLPSARPRPERNQPQPEEAVHARYVGWTGKDNLGDEAMLEAVRDLLPFAEVEVSGPPRHLLLLGGGTLINRSTYLGWLEERDSPRVERATIGTGVASPDYWGETEPVDGWVRWLTTCAYVGVRGPRSEAQLRRWGYEGPLEVCGDPALLFERPHDSGRPEGRVVMSPAWTDGELWGGSDERVLEAMTSGVRHWLEQGREVRFLSCNPADDRPIFEMMRAVGRAELDYVAGYRDRDAALRLLAEADLVIGERLHAVVLAAAVGTPFVAVEYRPKLADFAESVGAGGMVVRTDVIDRDRLVALGKEAPERRTAVAEAVAEYRRRLRRAATTIEGAVRA